MAELARVDASETDSFYASATSGDTERRLAFSAAIQRTCASAIARVFADHRVVGGSLLVKKPNDPASAVPPHLDWASVDESIFVGCNVWTPLHRTSIENGAMYVLPGS